MPLRTLNNVSGVVDLVPRYNRLSILQLSMGTLSKSPLKSGVELFFKKSTLYQQTRLDGRNRFSEKKSSLRNLLLILDSQNHVSGYEGSFYVSQKSTFNSTVKITCPDMVRIFWSSQKLAFILSVGFLLLIFKFIF